MSTPRFISISTPRNCLSRHLDAVCHRDGIQLGLWERTWALSLHHVLRRCYPCVHRKLVRSPRRSGIATDLEQGPNTSLIRCHCATDIYADGAVCARPRLTILIQTSQDAGSCSGESPQTIPVYSSLFASEEYERKARRHRNLANIASVSPPSPRAKSSQVSLFSNNITFHSWLAVPQPRRLLRLHPLVLPKLTRRTRLP